MRILDAGQLSVARHRMVVVPLLVRVISVSTEHLECRHRSRQSLPLVHAYSIGLSCLRSMRTEENIDAST